MGEGEWGTEGGVTSPTSRMDCWSRGWASCRGGQGAWEKVSGEQREVSPRPPAGWTAGAEAGPPVEGGRGQGRV